jgi:hypothetical protein
MTQKLGFYVNLEKCEIANQLVKRYGEYLQDMPLESRLTSARSMRISNPQVTK